MNKDVMTRMVKTYKTARNADDALRSVGYEGTPYAEIAGSIADAIYYMLGESTEKFDDSVTAKTLDNEYLSEEEQVNLLLAVCKKNESSLNLNDHVKEALRDAAEKRGVNTNSMISIILSEWVIRHAWMNNLVGA